MIGSFNFEVPEMAIESTTISDSSEPCPVLRLIGTDGLSILPNPTCTYLNWLVVDLPLWKMMGLVSWDHYSQYMENKIHVPNHQPDLLFRRFGDSDAKDYTKKSLQVGVEKITKMRIYTLNMSILGYHRTLAYIWNQQLIAIAIHSLRSNNHPETDNSCHDHLSNRLTKAPNEYSSQECSPDHQDISRLIISW